MEDKFAFLNDTDPSDNSLPAEDIDERTRRKIVFQTQNHIIDRIDQLEKEDKKRLYTHEDVRKEVNQLCTRLISSMNLKI